MASTRCAAIVSNAARSRRRARARVNQAGKQQTRRHSSRAVIFGANNARIASLRVIARYHAGKGAYSARHKHMSAHRRARHGINRASSIVMIFARQDRQSGALFCARGAHG